MATFIENGHKKEGLSMLDAEYAIRDEFIELLKEKK